MLRSLPSVNENVGARGAACDAFRIAAGRGKVLELRSSSAGGSSGGATLPHRAKAAGRRPRLAAVYERLWVERFEALDDVLREKPAPTVNPMEKTDDDVVLQTLRLTRRFEASPERVFDAWPIRTWPRDGCSPRQAATATRSSSMSASGVESPTVARASISTALGEYRVIDRPAEAVSVVACRSFRQHVSDVVVEGARRRRLT